MTASCRSSLTEVLQVPDVGKLRFRDLIRAPSSQICGWSDGGACQIREWFLETSIKNGDSPILWSVLSTQVYDLVHVCFRLRVYLRSPSLGSEHCGACVSV